MNAETVLLGTWRSCRFCHKADLGEHLIKYSTRHWAHPKCGLKTEGAKFFGRLTRWQLEQFPALIADDFGLLGKLRQRVRELRKLTRG